MPVLTKIIELLITYLILLLFTDFIYILLQLKLLLSAYLADS